MSPDKTETFINWLDEEEDKRGWTDYRLAAEAGISAPVLSRARSGIIPKWDACVAIAGAFHISPVTVFRKAGLLPAGQDGEVRFADWEYLLGKLPLDDQEEIRRIAEMKIEKRQKDKALKSLQIKKAG